MQQIARRVVHWISSNRISLSHLLRLRSDDALRAEVCEVACDDGTCAVRPLLKP
jgi:hypothetical protein